MTDDTQVLARVATWLGWQHFERPWPLEPVWLGPDGEGGWEPNVLLTGNGMLAIFQAMRKQPEEVRRKFADLIDDHMPNWGSGPPRAGAYVEAVKYDELTPELVARAADKAVEGSK